MDRNEIDASGDIQRRKIVEKYEKGVAKKDVDEWENPQYSVYACTDYYGFIHDDGLTDEFLDKESKIKRLDMKREAKWRKLLEKKSGKKRSNAITMGENQFGDVMQRMKESNFREELTKRVYKGVPQKFKSSLWYVFLDIGAIKANKPHVYRSMLTRALAHSPDIYQIDLDVNRTFRNTTYFRERYNGRQRALLHVLAAYSVYNTEIGYCQGMSEIAGLLLMYLVEEEDVFWGLSQLMTLHRYCMHGVFVAGFPRLLSFFKHLNLILNRLLPKLSRHFEQLDVLASSYALKWFMQCYLDRVPLTLFLRLWDIYLLEGEKLLFAMAYNILKMHKKRLMKMDHSSILYFLQSELRKDFAYDDDYVIESLKMCIEELRRHKLSAPGPPNGDELPTKPFGTVEAVAPETVTERQAVQANPEETLRRSLRRQQQQKHPPAPLSKQPQPQSANTTMANHMRTSDQPANQNRAKDPTTNHVSGLTPNSAKSSEHLATNATTGVKYRIHANKAITKSRSLYLSSSAPTEHPTVAPIKQQPVELKKTPSVIPRRHTTLQSTPNLHHKPPPLVASQPRPRSIIATHSRRSPSGTSSRPVAKQLVASSSPETAV